jgi:hypothetical protein
MVKCKNNFTFLLPSYPGYSAHQMYQQFVFILCWPKIIVFIALAILLGLNAFLLTYIYYI